MRISDWSSDVCSSDLAGRCGASVAPRGGRLPGRSGLLRPGIRLWHGRIRPWVIEQRGYPGESAMSVAETSYPLVVEDTDNAGYLQVWRRGRLMLQTRCACKKLRSEDPMPDTQSIIRFS